MRKGLIGEKLITQLAIACGYQVNTLPLAQLEEASKDWYGYSPSQVINYANIKRRQDEPEIKYNAQTVLDHLFKIDLVLSTGGAYLGLQLTTHTTNHPYYWERVEKVHKVHQLQKKAGIEYADVLSITLNKDYSIYNNLSVAQLEVLKRRFYTTIDYLCDKADGLSTKAIYLDARLNGY